MGSNLVLWWSSDLVEHSRIFWGHLEKFRVSDLAGPEGYRSEFEMSRKPIHVVYHSKAATKLIIMQKTAWKTDWCIEIYGQKRSKVYSSIWPILHFLIKIYTLGHFSSGFQHIDRFEIGWRVIFESISINFSKWFHYTIIVFGYNYIEKDQKWGIFKWP